MAKKKRSSAKQPRLSVFAEGFNDDAFIFCGGPDVDAACEQLAHLMWPIVEKAFKQAMRRKKEVRVSNIALKVQLMTKREVAEIPDL